MNALNDQRDRLSVPPPQIAFAWSGLPPYGLNGIRAVMVRMGVQPIVVGTRPDTSYDAIEAVALLPIHWVEPNDSSLSWSRLGEIIPDVLVVSGWATPAFNALGKQVREHGGSVIAMIDNRWRGDLRQLIAPAVFRTKYRNWFKAAIVPGRSARRFAKYIGIPNAAIHEGLYGCNPAIFEPGPPLAERPRRFLFVGRFEERKGIRELAAAWQAVAPQLPGWELHAVGEGPLHDLVVGTHGVRVYPFQQPAVLATFYREARFLILPSVEDHWGLVVHEATRSGCGLILSENVGARHDLATESNSFCFKPRSPASLGKAILRATQLNPSQLRAFYHESLGLAYRFGPQSFASAVEKAVDRIHKRG